MLANKQPKLIYGTSVEVDACIQWAEDLVVLCFVLFNCQYTIIELKLMLNLEKDVYLMNYYHFCQYVEI